MKIPFRALRLPRKLQVTFQGKWFLALTVGVGAAAINTGNNLLYLALSMNLSLIILSGVLSELCLRGLCIRVVHASEAFSSRESLLAITCSNGKKRFPSVAVSVSPVLPGVGKAALFSEIPPGKAETRIVPYHPRRRGPVPSFPCTVSTRFPFALFQKSTEVDPRGSPLIVYPEPRGPDIAVSGRDLADRTGGPAAGGREGPLLRGVRDLSPSDPVRDIHWKASARMGKWMVKEREDEPAQSVDIVVPAPSPPEEFEQLVSRICHLVLRCEREGLPYRLQAGNRVLAGPAHEGRRRSALSVLARVQADGTLLPAEIREGT